MHPRDMVALAASGLVALCACSTGGAAPCAPALMACELAAAWDEVTLAPGQEIPALCQSWTLDNPDELWVTGVVMDNDGGYHHSNWFFVPDHVFAVPDGSWPCGEHGFNELDAALLGGFLFAQSTQAERDSQSFAGGAAVRIPPYARIIGSNHLLNASDQPLSTRMRLRATTVPADEVAVKLVPARVEYRDLDIAPGAKSAFTTECDLAATHQDTLDAPLRYTLYHALPHYHELGTFAELALVGGPRHGDVLFRLDGHGESFGKTFDPPVDLVALGATGLRFTCGFLNPRSEPVGWGIGDQEMCVLALFADTDLAFEASVREGSGTDAGTGEDGTLLHGGPCDMFGVPWNHDKPGGPPR